MLCENEQIVIHPRCRNLIYHVKYAQWHFTRNGTFTGKFKNLKGNEEAGLLPSHADGLDALIYLVRNYDPTRSPFGPTLPGPNQHATTSYLKNNISESAQLMKSIFNVRK